MTIAKGEVDRGVPAGYQNTSTGRRMAPVRYLSTFLFDCRAAWWAHYGATEAQLAIGTGETEYRCPVAGRALDPNSPKIDLSEHGEIEVSPFMVRAATMLFFEKRQQQEEVVL